MAVKWTEEQQSVIDTRNRNILVSAAAGSGKTAVLVARILAMVTDEKRPVDIDRLLVVTFTNAAAAEMRERIRDALEQRAEAEPDNAHLQRQLVLVHNAKITTIHSFCLQVLRNHFQIAGIDPSFRVADQGEILLLEQECVREIVDEAYENLRKVEKYLENCAVQDEKEDEKAAATGKEAGITDAEARMSDAGARTADEEAEMSDTGSANVIRMHGKNTLGIKNALEFAGFIEMTATGKNDAVIEELILQMYHFSLGQPWPHMWLAQCRTVYQEWTEEHEPQWLSYIVEDAKQLLHDIREQIEEEMDIAQCEGGPYLYLPALEDDLTKVDALLTAEGYASMSEAFRMMGTYTALSRRKGDNIDPELKQLVQDMRQEMKDKIAGIRTHYFYDKEEVLRKEFAESGVVVRVLTRLVEQFSERIAQKKKEKNILDFGDLEHLALKVLVREPEQPGISQEKIQNKEENKYTENTDITDGMNRIDEAGTEKAQDISSEQVHDFMPTAAAIEYAELFEEIMIDEYQDSNLVQELILGSVAGRGKGEPNRFMVGDVKQSIYRFRLARPELFMEKYKTYRGGRWQDCRIDLHKNFRSRGEVLEGVNFMFRQIMTENPGGIVYDQDAALYPGAVFAPKPLTQDNVSATEVLLLEADGPERIREEAALVGRRIRELVGTELVWDKGLEQYRPARYSDIVVLLRTVSGWAETFQEMLGDMDIPCFTGSQSGYFSANEVRVVLSYLQILDNPVQDIPLAAVLRSAIGGFSDEELARIRAYSDAHSFYGCCRDYIKKNEMEYSQDSCKAADVRIIDRPDRDENLQHKLEEFFSVFEYLRGKCGHTPVHILLWELLEITGYGMYASSLPAGAQRKANLDMLVEKAIAYEATSYRGLYHFVRYIENLKKYDVDFGEANAGSEAENTVRIISIHKSKGLEFPIVFVSGMGKQFNESDIRSKIVLHPEYGAGCDFVDVKNRTRQATLLKKMIQQKTSSENLGEELRVLYVAVTRAREKLIMTGSIKDAASKLTKWNAQAGHTGGQLSYSCLSSASTYLDWVIPALLRHPCTDELLSRFGLIRKVWLASDAAYEVKLVNRDEYVQEDMRAQNLETLKLQSLLQLDPEGKYDQEARAYLERVFAAVYPHEADNNITGKLSVSELKKMSHVSEETEADELYREEIVIPLIPDFRNSEKEIVGAARGTVYHTFMENLDFSKEDELEILLEELITCGKMTREEGRALRFSDIRRFLKSDTGQKMRTAALNGRLFRERPFVIGVPANEIRPEWNPQETVLVQGIIDAYFHLPDDSIVLLDYKTDRVPDAQTLVQKYSAQLDYYAQALERLTGCRVRERVIWSFHLGREIVIQ